MSHSIPDVWPVVSKQIEKSLEYADGKYSLESIYSGLMNRDMQLWVAMDQEIIASMVTSFIQYPCKKVMALLFCGGERMGEWKHYIEQIKETAKLEGCDSVEAWGRPGWAKVLGFEVIHTVSRFKL